MVSKHAVRAFTECLQAELADEPEIHVTALMPQAVDTPIFEHAGNYTGRQVRPIPPVLDPDVVAAGIEACAEDPKLQVSYGLLGRALELLHAAAPLYRRLAHPAFVDGTCRLSGSAYGLERSQSSQPASRTSRAISA